MSHRSLTALALSACLFAPVASFAAAAHSAASDTTGSIAPVKGHNMVHITLKNVSNLEQNLVIQGRPVSLAANESTKIEVPSGTQIMGADHTIKLTIDKQFDGGVATLR